MRRPASFNDPRWSSSLRIWWLLVVSSALGLAACGSPSVAASISSYTAHDLYVSLRQIPQKEREAQLATVGALTFSHYAAQLAAHSTPGMVSLDGILLSDPAAQLTANSASYQALDKLYPSIASFWREAGINTQQTMINEEQFVNLVRAGLSAAPAAGANKNLALLASNSDEISDSYYIDELPFDAQIPTDTRERLPAMVSLCQPALGVQSQFWSYPPATQGIYLIHEQAGPLAKYYANLEAAFANLPMKPQGGNWSIATLVNGNIAIQKTDHGRGKTSYTVHDRSTGQTNLVIKRPGECLTQEQMTDNLWPAGD